MDSRDGVAGFFDYRFQLFIVKRGFGKDFRLSFAVGRSDLLYLEILLPDMVLSYLAAHRFQKFLLFADFIFVTSSKRHIKRQHNRKAQCKEYRS